MNIVLSVPQLKPLHKSSQKMKTTMKLNKFDNLKNKIMSLEKKRFSRLQDELKTKKSNLEEDLKEIDAIMKETFTKNMSDEPEMTAIVSIDEVQNDNDAFFDN
jgi:hypothetical protein|uniref:Uncharacterized protein n=1 Tax=viral metagenome TaxID=1070528 RepID=A0A6C0CUJ1_9ZZZZ